MIALRIKESVAASRLTVGSSSTNTEGRPASAREAEPLALAGGKPIAILAQIRTTPPVRGQPVVNSGIRAGRYDDLKKKGRKSTRGKHGGRRSGAGRKKGVPNKLTVDARSSARFCPSRLRSPVIQAIRCRTPGGGISRSSDKSVIMQAFCEAGGAEYLCRSSASSWS